MMRFEYDPAFVEQATFLVSSRDARRECLLHERLDPLYRIVDPELRQREFREASGELFRLFDLEDIIPAIVSEFPIIASCINRCIIREAERSRAQSADLHLQTNDNAHGQGHPVLIIALCPQSLLMREKLLPWLRRQLLHVQDMLDVRFAYSTQLPEGARVKQNIIRGRYGLLWDIYVEGRLIRSGRISDEAVPRLRDAFVKAFTQGMRNPASSTFEDLLVSSDLTHDQLLCWATNPELLYMNAEEEENVRTPEIGTCPVR